MGARCVVEIELNVLQDNPNQVEYGRHTVTVT